jgi:hypothetical protein
LVWVATGLNVAFMLAFVLLVPPYHGPDEPAHFDMIHQYQRDPLPRRPTTRVPFIIKAAPVDRAGRLLSPLSFGTVRKPRLSLAAAPPRRDRPTLAELGKPRPPVYNNMSQHPPLYYLIAAGLTKAITVPDSIWSWDRELFLARLISVLLVAPLAVLASAAVLAIRLPRGVGAIAAAFTLMIPQKSFIGSVVNNDALVMLLAAVSVVAALKYLAGGSPRTAWAAGAASGALALTKSTGVVVCAWVAVLVLCTAFMRWRGGSRADAWKALLGAGAFIAVGSSWYVYNTIRFGRPQPTPRRIIAHPVPTRFSTFLREFADLMSRNFWGRPASRLGVALPWWISHPLSMLTIAIVIFGALSVRSHRRYLLWLLALCAVHSTVLIRQNWRANRVHMGGPTVILGGLQGRYFFPLLVPIAVLVAAAFWSVLSRFSRAALVYAAAALIAIGTALHLVLGERMLVGYWVAPGVSYARHLHAVEAWSPLPVPLTIIMLALPCIVSAIALMLGVAWLRSRRAPAIEPA